MDTFRNATEDIVDEAIDGLVRASGGEVVRLARGEHTRVVLRRAVDRTKVSVVSGGGGGHEPLHAGLVGPGLLTAAVVGGVFASPSADAVLDAIAATTGPAGCLLVVKNYTGDTLNFTLAAERARLRGLHVAVVVVADDVARHPAPRPRGIAGVAFVHKVAGHFAAAGAPLAAVRAAAARAAARTVSLGVARGACQVPGRAREARIVAGHAELGLGIHGERGRAVVAVESAAATVGSVADALRAHVDPAKRYAALFNNLGGLPGLEALLLFNDFCATTLFAQVDFVMGPAALVTALDMPGFSLSLIELEPLYRDALLAPVALKTWPGLLPARTGLPLEYPRPPRPAPAAAAHPSHDPRARPALAAACAAAIAMQPDLDALDAAAGDADAGTTLASGARAVSAALDRLPLAAPGALLAAVGEIAAQAMGGSSGALLGILCAAGAAVLKSSADWPKAVDVGVIAMMSAGQANPGDRTCIDSLRPAADALLQGGSLADAADAARTGADATRNMSASAGRASYVPAEAVAGVPDAGAEAVARILKAMAEAVA